MTTNYEGVRRPDGPGPEVPLPRQPLRPGDRVGRYVVGEQLGQGGMGVVVAAHDPELGRQIALKVVRPDVDDSVHRARLVREARAMARLDHPNVVQVHDAGEFQGEVFVAMELVRGDTLGEWMRAQPRPWRDVVTRFIAAGRGLAAAHRAGLVHRDFKPDNVLIRATDGRICVTDFGLAIPAVVEAAASEPTASTAVVASSLTRTGAVAGTPAYMAPEQRRGKLVDARADVFSFCVSLHEGLYGVRPAPVTGAAAPAAGTGRAQPPAPRRPRHVPAAVRRAIQRGLEADPDARWPTIEPLLAALERATRRPRWVWSAAILATAAAAAVTAAAVVSRVPPATDGAGLTIDVTRRVTFTPGCEAQPAFLADGGVVYVERTGLASALHVLDSGDAGGIGAGAWPAVSPSGRYLAALDRNTVVVRDLQRPSAQPRRLGSSTGAPAWRGERELIVGVGSGVVARPLDGGGDRVLGQLPSGSSLRAAAVGTDGRIFVIHRADAAVAEDFVAEVMPGGAIRNIRRGVYSRAGLRYRAANRSVYFVQRMNSTQYHLFVQLADGVVEPRPLTRDTPPTGGFDLSQDGRRLVYSNCEESSVLARISRDGSLREISQRGRWRDGAPVTIDAERYLFTSTRTGELQVWLHDGERGDRPFAPRESSYPALSPDHRLAAYAAYTDDGTSTIVVRSLDDDEDVRVLGGGVLDRSPSFTPDASAVVFIRETSSGLRLYRTALAGGPAHEIVPDHVRAFDIAASTGELAYITPGRERDRLRLRTPAGELRDVPGAAQLGTRLRFVRFAPGGASLVTINGDGEIIELDLASGRTRPRWQLAGSPYIGVPALDFTADGEELVVSVIGVDGDVWLAEGSF